MDYRVVLLHLAVVSYNSLDEETKQAGREMVNSNLQYVFRSLTVAERAAVEVPVALPVLNEGILPIADIEMGLVPVVDGFIVQEAVELTFYEEFFESDFIRWVRANLGFEVVATTGSIILILQLTSDKAEDRDYMTKIISQISQKCYHELRTKMKEGQVIHCKLQTDPVLIANKLFRIAAEAQSHDEESQLSYKRTHTTEEVTATKSSRLPNKQLEQYKKKIEELNNSHVELKRIVNDVLHHQRRLTSKVESNTSVVDKMRLEFEGRTDELASKVDNVEYRVGELDTRVEDLETKVDTLEANVDNLETKVDDLETNVGDQESKVDDLETKAEELEARVDHLEQEL